MPRDSVPPVPEEQSNDSGYYIEQELADIRRELQRIKDFLGPAIEEAKCGPTPDLDE